MATPGAAGQEDRDAAIVEQLGRAGVLSTAQLAQLAAAAEGTEAFAERLARLEAERRVLRLPRVPSRAGPVTAWMLPERALSGPERTRRTALRLHLAAVYVALASGPRPFRWRLHDAEPATAEVEVPGKRRFYLLWGSDVATVTTACARFGAFLRDFDGERRDVADGVRAEALVLVDDPEVREVLREAAEAWRSRLPDEPPAVHVTLVDDAIRVLRTLVHGDPLQLGAVAPPEVRAATDADRLELGGFFQAP